MQMHRACVAGRLDAELLAVSKRVSKVLQRLQRHFCMTGIAYADASSLRRRAPGCGAAGGEQQREQGAAAAAEIYFARL